MQKNLLFLFIFFTVSTLSSAQTGVVRGRVLDKEQNLPLPGATITFPDIKKGTVSDVNGYFQLLNIPIGKQKLNVSYIGFEGNTQMIDVTEKSTTQLSIKLASGFIEGKEVIVMGDRLKGQAKALNQQKNNTQISNIVSADQVGRFPDSNIGDALKRIPGLTVQNDQGEARYGLVRGLEARLNSVMVNGERLPSADGTIRSVQLDLIPSDIVQSIEVSKALTPEMDGDAIGGSVNLVTRSAPEGLRISTTLGSGFNFLTNKPIYQGSAVIGNRFFNNKLGVVLSGNYNNHFGGSDNAEYIWAKTSDADGAKPYITDLQVRSYNMVHRIRRSGSLALDYKLGANSKITFNGTLIRRDDYENRLRLRYRFNNGARVKVGTGSYAGFPDADGIVKGARVEVETKGGADDVRNARLERQTTYTTTLAGEHLLANTLKINWSATYALASENRPTEYYNTFRMPATDLKPNISNPEFANVAPITLAYDKATIRPFQVRNDYTDEKDFNARLDFQLPIQKSGDFSNTLKFGGRLRTKEKNRANSRGFFDLPTGKKVAWSDIESKDYTDAGFLAGERQTKYIAGLFPTPASLGVFQSKFGANYRDAPEEYIGDNFRASENITSGYLQLNQNLGKKLFALVGFRLENTTIDYTGNIVKFDKDGKFLPVTKQSKTDSYNNILPALHLKYDFDNQTVIRMAWTNSLARPNYIDLVPRRNENIEELFEGNPALLPTTSMNFDVMAEHYFKNVGLISIGAFHKQLKNVIFAYTTLNYKDPVSGKEFLRYTQPRNGSEASLTGIEVAFQRQIWKGLGVYTNYTFNSSEVNGIQDVTRTLPLPGTAKHNVNASLSYETKKLVLRLSLNFHSEFIDPEETVLTNDAFFDRYQDRMQQLDFNGSYAFTQKLRFYFEANNLTNQPLRFYQGSRKYTAQTEYYSIKTNFGLKFDF